MRTFLGASALLAALAICAPVAAQIALQPGEVLLEVQAEGQARYLPDAAFLNAGVISTGITARAATDANAKQMAAVIAAIRAAGIEARYIRTQQISVQPRFARGGPSDPEGQAQITGYVARNGVAVTVARLTSAPNVIAAAFGAGANSVYGPNLGSSDPGKGLDDARRDALVKARVQADTYAVAMGMRVERVLRVSERGNATRSLDYVVLNRVSSGTAPTPPPPPQMNTPIAGGEMERRVTVWVDYAIKP